MSAYIAPLKDMQFAIRELAGLAEITALPGCADVNAELVEAAGAWTEVLRECADAAPQFPELPPEAWWEVALERFGAQRREADKPSAE